MGFRRRMVTAVLAVMMILTMAIQAFAAGSPVKPPKPDDKNPSYVNNHDRNRQDHGKGKGTMVVTKLGKTKGVVHMVTSDGATVVSISDARDRNNKKQPITHLGGIGDDGVKPLQPFNNKTGKSIRQVDIRATAAVFRFSARAFGKSNVEVLRVAGNKIQFANNMFVKTNVPDIQIQICGTNRKASQFTFEKGCFKALNSNAEIVVKSTAMTVPQYNLLVKQIRAAGFPGTIRRGRP